MKLMLAPMAGVTDMPFRILAKRMGADVVTSEMVSAQGLIHDNHRTHQILTIAESERPVAIQLFGHDPEVLARAAVKVEIGYHPDMIDINMGCPTPKIVKNGDGSALLKDLSLATAIVEAVCSAVTIPVTVKTRLGWDEESIVCLEFVERIGRLGVKWITLHARTRSQFYSGKADWTWIRRAKEASSVPIVGNGDVASSEDALRMLEETGCDHIAIGRGALGNPWIFTQIKARIAGEPSCEPTLRQRVDVLLEHLTMKVEHDGESRAVREMRPQIAWYLKGVPKSAQVRSEVNAVQTVDEVKELVFGLLQSSIE